MDFLSLIRGIIKNTMCRLGIVFLIFFGSLESRDLLCQRVPHSSNGEIINHTYFSLSYLESFEQAEWVHYKLTQDMVSGHIERTNKFKKDFNVTTGSSSPKDFYKSGYHKGHLAPAGDMRHNKIAMNEIFLMSNISPQVPSFNMGIWKQLELLVRSWAKNGDLYVVTGGVLEQDLAVIGPNRVACPRYFYKIIYSPINSAMIGFILPNTKVKNSLNQYAVTVDSIEVLTSIDFFYYLPDDLENGLESSIELDKWDFRRVENGRKSPISKSLQCRGIAKSTGKRCRNKTTNKSQFCYAHQGQDVKVQSFDQPSTRNPKCRAITKAGVRCSRSTTRNTHYCWQHQEI